MSKQPTLNGFPIQRMSVAQLKPADWNPRKMPHAELEKLRRSVETFGMLQPIIWNKRSKRVVGGHQRVKVLLANHCAETDVVVVDLDDTLEKQLNIALNRIHGDWDDNLLHDLLKDLQAQGADLALTGFDDDEIADMFKENTKEVKGEIELGPELLEEHNILILYFDNEMDWRTAIETFGLKKVTDRIGQAARKPNGQVGRSGLNTVISGADVLRMINRATA